MTFNSMYWHAAYNVEFTVSVNNTFMTAYEVPQVSGSGLVYTTTAVLYVVVCTTTVVCCVVVCTTTYCS